MMLLANVPSQSEIEARLSRLKEGKLMAACCLCMVSGQLVLFFHLVLFNNEFQSCLLEFICMLFMFTHWTVPSMRRIDCQRCAR